MTAPNFSPRTRCPERFWQVYKPSMGSQFPSVHWNQDPEGHIYRVVLPPASAAGRPSPGGRTDDSLGCSGQSGRPIRHDESNPLRQTTSGKIQQGYESYRMRPFVKAPSSATTAKSLVIWPEHAGKRARHADTVLKTTPPASVKGTCGYHRSVPIVERVMLPQASRVCLKMAAAIQKSKVAQ